jgi:hypothetical protein
MKQILQNLKTGGMELAEVPAPLERERLRGYEDRKR